MVLKFSFEFQFIFQNIYNRGQTCFIPVLQTFQLKVKFNETLPNKFMTVRGGTVMEVEDKRGSYNLMYTVLHWLRLAVQRDVEEIPFDAFNQSCIGVYSNVRFKAELFIKSTWFLYLLLSHNVLCWNDLSGVIVLFFNSNLSP